VAGCVAVQVGAHHLQKAAGGSGVLLGGVPGVAPARVVVLGDAIENLVPFLGVHLLGELHRALRVGEKHGELLSFSFEQGTRLEDPLPKVLWRVFPRVARRARGTISHRGIVRSELGAAEPFAIPTDGATRGAQERELGAAAAAEPTPESIVVATCEAPLALDVVQDPVTGRIRITPLETLRVTPLTTVSFGKRPSPSHYRAPIVPIRPGEPDR